MKKFIAYTAAAATLFAAGYGLREFTLPERNIAAIHFFDTNEKSAELERLEQKIVANPQGSYNTLHQMLEFSVTAHYLLGLGYDTETANMFLDNLFSDFQEKAGNSDYMKLLYKTYFTSKNCGLALGHDFDTDPYNLNVDLEMKNSYGRTKRSYSVNTRKWKELWENVKEKTLEFSKHFEKK